MRRVLIGPANSAGQAAAWATALRREGCEARSLSFRRRPGARRLTDATDLHLPYPRATTPLGRRRRAGRLARGFSHVAIDGFTPILGPVLAGLQQGELTRLAEWGPRLALIAHGSDVRDPVRHLRDFPDSYFPFIDEGLHARLVHRSVANRALAESSALPCFVSTPDLLLDLPEATWLPLCVDPGPWVRPQSVESARPRILHVPSSAMKGSDVIDPALRSLADRRLIEYVRPAGIPHSKMPRLIASVDVVVDQIRSGSYGVTGVEAMMSGKVVVGNLSQQVRDQLPKPSPIVDAPPENFRQVIEGLLDTRASWSEHGARTREFAVELHDGRASAHALSSFVRSDLSLP